MKLRSFAPLPGLTTGLVRLIGPVVEGSDGTDPDAREHVERDLGLAFWLHRTDPTD